MCALGVWPAACCLIGDARAPSNRVEDRARDRSQYKSLAMPSTGIVSSGDCSVRVPTTVSYACDCDNCAWVVSENSGEYAEEAVEGRRKLHHTSCARLHLAASCRREAEGTHLNNFPWHTLLKLSNSS